MYTVTWPQHTTVSACVAVKGAVLSGVQWEFGRGHRSLLCEPSCTRRVGGGPPPPSPQAELTWPLQWVCAGKEEETDLEKSSSSFPGVSSAQVHSSRPKASLSANSEVERVRVTLRTSTPLLLCEFIKDWS